MTDPGFKVTASKEHTMDTTSKRNHAFPAAKNPVKASASTDTQQAVQAQNKINTDTGAKLKATSGVGFGWRNHLTLNQD